MEVVVALANNPLAVFLLVGGLAAGALLAERGRRNG